VGSEIVVSRGVGDVQGATTTCAGRQRRRGGWRGRSEPPPAAAAGGRASTAPPPPQTLGRSRRARPRPERGRMPRRHRAWPAGGRKGFCWPMPAETSQRRFSLSPPRGGLLSPPPSFFFLLHSARGAAPGHGARGLWSAHCRVTGSQARPLGSPAGRRAPRARRGRASLPTVRLAGGCSARGAFKRSRSLPSRGLVACSGGPRPGILTDTSRAPSQVFLAGGERANGVRAAGSSCSSTRRRGREHQSSKTANVGRR
jgi:hypothetical protein